METIRLFSEITKDGELHINGLPCRKGEKIEILLFRQSKVKFNDIGLTAKELKESGIVGFWKNRDDFDNSSKYARLLRERAQRRQ
ncbi:MAG: hypothetical protein GY866_00990 [Proteobacteria bacterium]|nr:hypothetical protein [Pseudomonadota bacterium]